MRKPKEGSLRKRPDGYWEARYYANGKYYSVYDRIQAKCLEKLKAAVKNKSDKKKTSYNLEEWYKKWLKVYKEPKLKAASIQSIEITFTKYILPRLGKRDINKLSALEIQQVINDVPFDRQREITYKNLNNCLDRAYKIKLIKDNPMTAVEIDKASSEQWETLTIEQQNAFIEKIKGDKFENLFLFYLLTGARRNEALKCKWEDIDFEKRIITLYSTKREKKGQERKIKRYVHMSEQLYNILNDMTKGKDDDYIFNNLKDINHRFAEIRDSLGFSSKIVIHSLRKTFATRCHEAGIPTKIIQTMLGHSTPDITERVYIKVLPDWQAKFNSKIDTLYPYLYPYNDDDQKK